MGRRNVTLLALSAVFVLAALIGTLRRFTSSARIVGVIPKAPSSAMVPSVPTSEVPRVDATIVSTKDGKFEGKVSVSNNSGTDLTDVKITALNYDRFGPKLPIDFGAVAAHCSKDFTVPVPGLNVSRARRLEVIYDYRFVDGRQGTSGWSNPIRQSGPY